jgi:VIT1/CCC1 family predicted Fe2+/Mn2+ transporter
MTDTGKITRAAFIAGPLGGFVLVAFSLLGNVEWLFFLGCALIVFGLMLGLTLRVIAEIAERDLRRYGHVPR